MPTILTHPPIEAEEPRSRRKRWTRAECDFLERSGLLTERYELIDGEIILKVGQNHPHAMTVTRLFAWLIAVFGVARVQTQATIEVTEEDQSLNRPEPDAAVLARPDYEIQGTPAGSDLLLVAEVSDATLRDDLRTKAMLYARAGIPEYWVLDVPSRRLFVHRQPAPEGYAELAAYAEEETLALSAAPESAVRVADLLPPT